MESLSIDPFLPWRFVVENPRGLGPKGQELPWDPMMAYVGFQGEIPGRKTKNAYNTISNYLISESVETS